MRTAIEMEWRPVGTQVFSVLNGRRLTVGDVIAWEWAAWRVEHVQDAIPTADEERYAVSGCGPYRVSVRRLHGPSHPKERDSDHGLIALRMSPWRGVSWVYEAGRVPLCSCCGDPFPYRASLAERAAAQAAVEAENAEMTAVFGGCQACGEPVTRRQGSVVFPEPDVRVPFGVPPRFHTRLACASGAAAYEAVRQRAIAGVSRVVDVNGRVLDEAPLIDTKEL